MSSYIKADNLKLTSNVWILGIVISLSLSYATFLFSEQAAILYDAS
jgi:hypothetical protein